MTLRLAPGLLVGWLALAVFAAAGACGGGPTGTVLDTCLQDGAWVGTGTCGISSFTMSMSDSAPELTGFGGNAAASFAPNSGRTQAIADGLIILNAPDHHCWVSCLADKRLALTCTNKQGGSCASTFTPAQAASP